MAVTLQAAGSIPGSKPDDGDKREVPNQTPLIRA